MGASSRIVRKLKSFARAVRRESPALTTLSPIFLPWQGTKFVDQLNNNGVWLQVSTLLKLLGTRPDLLWIENPRASDALDWFPNVPSVYHVSDAFWECPYTRDKSALRRRDEELTKRCGVVICVSDELFAIKARVRSSALYYLGHGVDYERFAAAAASGARSPHLEGLAQPIVGYFGTLTNQNDIPLLEWCATNAPDISFVFGGTVTGGDYGPLRRLPNTRFLGQVPYDEIPALAVGFGVCILPWRQTEWIRHCNPLKTYEYFASGRPIVSVPINEVQRIGGDLVSFAATPEEFLNAIRWELSNDNPARADARQQLAEPRSWERHHSALADLLMPLLDCVGEPRR